MLAACERNAPLNAALFMLLHGEHDKRIRAVLLSLESVLLWLTEVWVGWVCGWLGGVKRAISCGGWVGGLRPLRAGWWLGGRVGFVC